MTNAPKPGSSVPAIPNYGTDTPQPASHSEALSQVTAMYLRVQTLQREVAETELAAKNAKTKLAMLIEGDLPTLMQQLGMKSFRMENGVTVEVKDQVFNSIPAARREEAMAWLDENGHGAVIKREVSVPFGIGEETLAQKCMARIMQEFNKACAMARKVEPSTLKSIIIQRIAAGKPMPTDLFGIHTKKVAEFKGAPKEGE